MTTGQIIALVIVLCLAIVGGVCIVKKSKEHSLVKWTGLFFLLAVALTWIFAGARYQGTQIMDYGMTQQGITDIPSALYQSIYLAGDKIIFLLMLGAFYAVLNKNAGYRKIVTGIAKKFEGKEIIFVLISSFLVTAMSSMFIQSFAVLIFIPFLVSILSAMKMDKITTFCATFGSMLIGLLGVIYGGEGSEWFNYYTGITTNGAVLYRLVLLVLSFLIFNIFTMLHVKKELKNNKLNEVIDEPFKVEKVGSEAKKWPIIVVLCLITILVLLGYINWDKLLGITTFANVHKWVTELTVGNIHILSAILGTSAAALGTWNLFTASALLGVMSILIGLISGVRFNDFISAYEEGFKKISKPLGIFILAYMVMMIAYLSPFVPTITNLLFKNVKEFNPFIVAGGAFLTNIFHLDLGYTGFIVGSFYAGTFASNINQIQTIFYTTYGLVGLFVPTQAILLIGLSYLNIDYKSWFKHIWKFVLIAIILLLILFVIIK